MNTDCEESNIITSNDENSNTEESTITIAIESEKINLAKSFGINNFQTKIANEVWNLSLIKKYLCGMDKDATCEFTDECDNQVSYINRESKKILCTKHYFLQAYCDSEEMIKFENIESFLISIEKQCKDIDMLLLCIKATLSLIKSNLYKDINYYEIVDQCELFEKEINNSISVIFEIIKAFDINHRIVSFKTTVDELKFTQSYLIKITVYKYFLL